MAFCNDQVSLGFIPKHDSHLHVQSSVDATDDNLCGLFCFQYFLNPLWQLMFCDKYICSSVYNPNFINSANSLIYPQV